VLRKIFGPAGEAVTGDWRKLHNEELHGLYCSPDIVWVITSRRMRWARHVARRGQKRNAHGCFGGNLMETSQLELLGMEGE
jgi:hypothetical protein